MAQTRKDSNEKDRLHTVMDRDLKRRLRIASAEDNEDMSDIIDRALRRELDQRKQPQRAAA